MRIKTLALTTLASAALGFAAYAQESAPTPAPADQATPPAAENAAQPSSAKVGASFAAGAPVEDAAGGTVGTIQSVTDGADGQVVVVQIDGALYGLPASSFSTASGKVVANKTKAQIKASSQPTK